MRKRMWLLLAVFAIMGCQGENGENNQGGGGTGGDVVVDVAPDKANPLADKVYYEIFVRSFADSDGDGIGDLNGVTAKLDYLEDLGIQGIWLMPINPSPSYHGYDVTDYKEVNPDYGTLADFDNLVSSAKAHGIEIILDFVINHTSQEHPWFKNSMTATDAEYRNYYTYVHKDEVQQKCEAGEVAMVDDNKYVSGIWRSPWGDGNTLDYRYIGQFDGSMPDLNYGRVPDLNPVYDEILGAAKFWMERGIAGLRLDAVKHIYQNENGGENLKFLKRFYDDLQKDYSNIYMVGEVLGDAAQTAPFFLSLPTMFHFDSWWKLSGAMMDWGAKYYAKDMQTLYNSFKIQNSEFNAALKLSNHDEDRTMSVLGGSVERAKVAAMAILTTPGQPFIYYGEELGMENTKSNGDEAVREPMLWGDEFTTKWRENTAPTSTVETQLQSQKSLLTFYRKAIKMRNATPALQHGTFTPIAWEKLPTNFMAWHRDLADKRVYILMNGGNTSLEHTIDYDTAGSKELLTEGSYHIEAKDGKTTVSLDPYSIVILEKTF